MADRYTPEQRFGALEAALQAVAGTVPKRIEPSDIAALADAFNRSFRAEPVLDVVDAIDAWSRSVSDPSALPGTGVIWRFLGDLRREAAARRAAPDTDRGGDQGALFGGSKGDPMPDYLRDLAGPRALSAGLTGLLGDIFRTEIVGHQHAPRGSTVDPTEGCDACDLAARRRADLVEVLAGLPDTGGTGLSTCRGCDGSGWVEILQEVPAWQGVKRQTIWDRCPECNDAVGRGAA